MTSNTSHEKDDSSSQKSPRNKGLVRFERSQMDPHNSNYYYVKQAASSSLVLSSGPDTRDSFSQFVTNPDDIPSTSANGTGLSYFCENLSPQNTKEKTPMAEKQAPQPSPEPKISPATTRVTDVQIEEPRGLSVWSFYCRVITLPATSWILFKCGIASPQRQEAWREKIGWIVVISIVTLVVGFFIIGFHSTLCGWPAPRLHFQEIPHTSMVIHGIVYDISQFRHESYLDLPLLLEQFPELGGKDASLLFQNVNANCKGLIQPSTTNKIYQDENGLVPWYLPCKVVGIPEQVFNIYSGPSTPTALNTTFNYSISTTFPSLQANYSIEHEPYYTAINRLYFNISSTNITEAPTYGYGCHLSNISRKSLYSMPPNGEAYYTWDDVENNPRLTSFRGSVISLTRLDYLNDQDWILNPTLRMLRDANTVPCDLTDILSVNSSIAKIGHCLVETAKVGVIEGETGGCIMSRGVLYLSLLLIISIISVKFLFAVYFEWCFSWKEPVYPLNIADDSSSTYEDIVPIETKSSTTSKPSSEPLKVVCLVTVYRESKEGLVQCIDSVVNTCYPSSEKLLLVVCDGLVLSSDSESMTYELVLNLMKPLKNHTRLVKVEDLSYVSVGSGDKRLNKATIYYGQYDNEARGSQYENVGMICIVKTGLELEKEKRGNRGKRDSQVLLMSFLHHVFFHDRMSSLENELYYAMVQVNQCSPVDYDACLMVDADTKVLPDSLLNMVSCLKSDPYIMGLCGETMIENRRDSWVTMIQVFEYFISHHLNKSFESVFGGVTCLPGCFCMYRIKIQKGSPDLWLPILANPDIVCRYAMNVVDTLHLKNLLLLGEDRYLSTLMLKTFARRKLVFLPSAKCTTVVPNTFAVLLDQRRRWINSTIHNLIELILVRDLCGVFCISMQFVVLAELIGTLTLPAAMLLTLYLAISSIYRRPVPWMPLLLLLCILGMPAVLIFLTARKWSWFVWMLVYLVSLPIWNLVLPLNACKHNYPVYFFIP